ncbi:hypothetical protein LTR62_005132 [Meristemomyces frigidus]|uniref:Uncharacterized protein n=1 Tax=Meristemomyces frigidus TaxID=1508187 RepID=A0AAN7YSC3_9PEZI|nr:hypothetical protein LTR62_005132 [Meristemomyces frigidus]
MATRATRTDSSTDCKVALPRWKDLTKDSEPATSVANISSQDGANRVWPNESASRRQDGQEETEEDKQEEWEINDQPKTLKVRSTTESIPLPDPEVVEVQRPSVHAAK